MEMGMTHKSRLWLLLLFVRGLDGKTNHVEVNPNCTSFLISCSNALASLCLRLLVTAETSASRNDTQASDKNVDFSFQQLRSGTGLPSGWKPPLIKADGASDGSTWEELTAALERGGATDPTSTPLSCYTNITVTVSLKHTSLYENVTQKTTKNNPLLGKKKRKIKIYTHCM